ncbi:MAG: cyclic nucleotide-binding domain-containing protein [Clostridiales bacterium]|jgi:CRP/FNR family putative post-exponential-phase nitrogen-starvation transcriptional regulator|nr:cyclic nucleotide-binding domain-containing protein [Clostridiales bacterium]
MKQIDDRARLEKYIESSGIQAQFSVDLADMARLLQFSAGEFLIRRGDPSRYLYFLVEGKVKLIETGASGKRILYGYMRSSGALGEVASLWGRKPRLSVQAVEVCLCLAIDLELHREALFSDNRFLRYLCKLLAERVTQLDNNIASLMSCPIESRLAAFILENSEGCEFRISLTECAEFTSTSYRHLIRVMNALCDRGILRRSRQQFEILDREQLTALAESAYACYL